MIKFFRNIRQKLLSKNKFSKYLFYALGEIFLVIIGILIALQINNTNSKRIELKTFKNNLQYVVEDLENNASDLNELKEKRQNVVKQNKYILETIKEGGSLNSFEIMYNLRVLDWGYFHKHESGFERINSSGLYESDAFFDAREKIRSYNQSINRFHDTEKRLNEFLETMEIEMFKEGSHLDYMEYAYLWIDSNGKPNEEQKTEIDNFRIDFDKMIRNNPAMLSILRRSLIMIEGLNRGSDYIIKTGEEVRIEIDEYLSKK